MEQGKKSSEKEDYGATGRTKKKPAAVPKEGPAPVHRGDDTARSGGDAALRKADRRRDEERAR